MLISIPIIIIISNDIDEKNKQDGISCRVLDVFDMACALKSNIGNSKFKARNIL